MEPHEDPPFIVTFLVGLVLLLLAALFFGGCERILIPGY